MVNKLSDYNKILDSIKKTSELEDLLVYRKVLLDPFMGELAYYFDESHWDIPYPLFITIAKKLHFMWGGQESVDRLKTKSFWTMKDSAISYLERNSASFDSILAAKLLKMIINVDGPIGLHFREFFEKRMIELPEHLRLKKDHD